MYFVRDQALWLLPTEHYRQKGYDASGEGDEELPLDFTFTKVEEDWRIARINRVYA